MQWLLYDPLHARTALCSASDTGHHRSITDAVQCIDAFLCLAAVRRAPSASSADFASALSPSVRTSGDESGSATTAGAGERESFLSRSAALLKKVRLAHMNIHCCSVSTHWRSTLSLFAL